MKIAALLVVLSLVLVSGCVGGGREPGATYSPPTAQESFSIGAFQPSKTEYNIKHYDDGKAMAFLASVSDRFSAGDVAAVDGLKWERTPEGWEPIPNPPVPVLEPGGNMSEHARKYAEWVNEHPHFGYPPLPMDDKQ